MTANTILQLLLYCVLLVAVAKPLGAYMARVYQGEATTAQRIFGPLERLIYRVVRVDPREEMTWKAYALAVMLFNVAGLLAVYLLQRLQGVLPANPAGLGAVTPDSSFNTAMSFATNTNWQGYGGETTLSYLTQMLGLTVQNFVSAATGMAVLVALIRGFSRKTTTDLGNFWVDLDSGHALHPPPALDRLRARPGLAGRRPDFRPYASAQLLRSDEGRRRQDGHRASSRSARCVADHHQAARHERRRVLQRELGAPVREPDRPLELRRDVLDPPHSRRALLHVRQDGRGHAAGLGRARRDVRHLPAAALALRLARAGG